MFAKELGFDKVVMEGDSETVIKAILGDYMDCSYMGHVQQDIKFFCFLDFPLFQLSTFIGK